MLVLTRHRNEQIIIPLTNNKEIVITVVRTGPMAVRLGIDAPEELLVHRREVWEAIKRQQATGISEAPA
jgi:carbon storage regulator